MIFDEALVVPDMDEPLEAPSSRGGAPASGSSFITRPCCEPSPRISTSAPRRRTRICRRDFKKVLLNGSGEDESEFKFWRAGKVSSIDRPFEGVLPNLERLATDSESEFIRNRLKAYMTPQFCDVRRQTVEAGNPRRHARRRGICFRTKN
jgi:excinuclease ABC subunit A